MQDNFSTCAKGGKLGEIGFLLLAWPCFPSGGNLHVKRTGVVVGKLKKQNPWEISRSCFSLNFSSSLRSASSKTTHDIILIIFLFVSIPYKVSQKHLPWTLGGWSLFEVLKPLLTFINPERYSENLLPFYTGVPPARACFKHARRRLLLHFTFAN